MPGKISGFAWVLTIVYLGALAPAAVPDLNEILQSHPAGAALLPLFANPNAPLPTDFEPTKLTKKDYLKLIAGNVDFWKKHLNPDGALIDFYEKAEKQYSTPAFALSAAILVKEAGRDDLLEPAVRSFNFALTALQNKTTAN